MTDTVPQLPEDDEISLLDMLQTNVAPTANSNTRKPPPNCKPCAKAGAKPWAAEKPESRSVRTGQAADPSCGKTDTHQQQLCREKSTHCLQFVGIFYWEIY